MKNVADQAVCRRCGKTYSPRSNFAKWCDSCCTFTCKWCGKTFRSRRNRAIRFCSLDCTNAWQETAKEEARQRTIRIRGSGQILKCLTCQQPFYAPGHRMRNGMIKYCQHACRNYHEDMKGINRVLRFPAVKEANKLELAGREILAGILEPGQWAEQQVIAGKFVVDVLIPSDHLVIQWDGDFWHGNPTLYANFWPIQEANRNRDRSCNAYLTKCGYRVMRFWENDVHDRPFWVSAEIERALASSART